MGHSNITAGLFILLISGIINGSAAVPLKYTKKSEWQNLWLIQSILAMIVLPWLLVAMTINRPADVFRAAGSGPLAAAAGFGFGWGIGTLLYIIGVVMVGLSISFGIILSLTATLGALFPLLILHPQEIHSWRGHLLLLSMVFTVIGVVLCALAGAGRIEETAEAPKHAEKRYFWRGVVVCVLSGIFSPMLNFAFAFGDKISTVAMQFGASPLWAPNALWAIAFTAAFGLNAIYCLYHLGVQKSWTRFLDAPAENLVGGAVMGVLLFSSIITYGMGAEMLGTWGVSAGWAINMSSTIFAANIWGLGTGEWRGAPKKSYLQLAAGLLAITIAIILASPSS